MKRIFVLLFIGFLCFSLTSCGNGKKMKGFTYEELAEYFSAIEGLTALGEAADVWEAGEYILQEDGTYRYEGENHYEIGQILSIPCGDDKLRTFYSSTSLNRHNSYLGIDLYNLLQIELLFPGAWRSFLVKGPKVPQVDPKYYSIAEIFGRNDAIRAENNIANVIRHLGVKSTPDWKEWMDYEIPFHLYNSNNVGAHGFFNLYWYNPLTEDFQRGVFYTQNENSTELYVVFQENSLFSAPYYENPSRNYDIRYFAPLIMSEKMYDQLKTEYPSFKYEDYKKGTVKEFSDWFMGGYQKEIPDVFAKIEDEFVYYPAYGNGVHPDDLNGNEYDCDALFIPDMKDLGVDFDKLRSYIFKITVPHDGVFSDIHWELIG